MHFTYRFSKNLSLKLFDLKKNCHCFQTVFQIFTFRITLKPICCHTKANSNVNITVSKRTRPTAVQKFIFYILTKKKASCFLLKKLKNVDTSRLLQFFF